MCRIARFFLLQMLKGSMSGDVCELPTSFFISLQGKAPKKIHTVLTETLGENAPRMPPSKTGWASLNVVIFPPAWRLVLDDPNQ